MWKIPHANELSDLRGLCRVRNSAATMKKKIKYFKRKRAEFPLFFSFQSPQKEARMNFFIWQCVLDSKSGSLSSGASRCVVPSRPRWPAPGAFPGFLHFCFISKLELRPLETQGPICWKLLKIRLGKICRERAP